MNVADDDEIKHEASLTKKTENPHVQGVRNSQEGVQNLDIPPPLTLREFGGLNRVIIYTFKKCYVAIISRLHAFTESTGLAY